jgi:thiol-disulfide isomerase/thioredoxin
MPKLLLVCLICLFLVPVSLAETPARKVPPFKLKLIDGSTITAKKLQGRVTVIDFWATWCKPCIQEIGDYNRFYRDYKKKGLRFLALAVDSGSEAEVRAAVQELKIKYPVASPSLKQLDIFGDISVFPTTWLVDSNGAIIKIIEGVPPDKHKTLRDTVDTLLKN